MVDPFRTMPDRTLLHVIYLIQMHVKYHPTISTMTHVSGRPNIWMRLLPERSLVSR